VADDETNEDAHEVDTSTVVCVSASGASITSRARAPDVTVHANVTVDVARVVLVAPDGSLTLRARMQHIQHTTRTIAGDRALVPPLDRCWRH